MYGKIFGQIFEGSLTKTGEWKALVTLQQMIILSDRDGIIDMTAQAIASKTTIPLEIIEAGIAFLELPDPQSRTPDEEGRRLVRLSESRDWGWRVVNKKMYSKIKTQEDRREYHRQYWHERKLNKSNINSTPTQHLSTPLNTSQPNSNHIDIDIDVNKDQDQKLLVSSKPSKNENKKNGTRLPDDWALSHEQALWARNARPDIDVTKEAEKFADFWQSKPGAGARKLDWNKTWKNWVRNAGGQRFGNSAPPQNAGSIPSQRPMKRE